MIRVRGGRGGASQAGIALLLVVWLLALLTVIAGEFMASGRVKAAAERNKLDDLRGLALALAGYRAAVAALDAQIEGLKLDASGRLLLFYPGLADGVPATADDVPLGEGTYSWRIIDQDGLVNINTGVPRSVLAHLLSTCGLGPGVERDTVIDSLLDWRDQNREHRLNGAEEDYYRSLDPPYSCKDGLFDVVEELLLVRGVTPLLFAGGEVDGQKIPGLRDLVSLQGQYPPNNWTAPQDVLDACKLPAPNPGQNPPAPPQEGHFEILATGKPSGGGPPRSLRAVVLRQDAAGSRIFTLLYWNDTYIPE